MNAAVEWLLGDNGGAGVSAPDATAAGKTVRTGELARALGRTDVTIRNWIGAGLPHVVVDGQARFNLAEATEWAAKHRGVNVGAAGSVKGGVRPGAGRPPGRKARAPKLPDAADDPVNGIIGAAGANKEDERLAKQLAAEERARVVANFWDDPSADASVIGITNVDATTQRNIIEVRTKQLELEKARGEVLNKTEVEQAQSEAINGLRMSLEALPEAVSDHALTVLGIGAAESEKLRAFVDETVRAALTELARKFEQAAAPKSAAT